MKTIIVSTISKIGTLCIAGLFFSLMSFRNPPQSKNQNKVTQLRDTVPDTDNKPLS